MIRDIALIVGAGVASGLLYASLGAASVGSLLLALLSPLPLFLVGLSRGAVSALAAGVVGAVVVGVLLATALAGLQHLLAISAPVAWLCQRALLSRPGADARSLEWYPPGLLLGWLAAIASGFFFVTFAFFLGDEAGLQGRIAELLGAVMRQFSPEGGLSEEALAGWAAMVPGLSALWWMLMMVGNGAAAQGILRRSGRALRPSPPLADLELPRSFAIVVAAGFVASFLPDPISLVGRTLAIIFLVPYFFLGLALLHSVAARWPSRALILAIAYVLIFVLGWPAVVVAGLGIVEQFMGFRRRGGASNREDE